eukprot:COSAG01_NODE_10996_length_2030_cov_4.856551_1_plen_592_part_10
MLSRGYAAVDAAHEAWDSLCFGLEEPGASGEDHLRVILGEHVHSASDLALAKAGKQGALTHALWRAHERSWRTVSDRRACARLTACGGTEAGWVTQPPTRPEYRLSSAQWRTAMCKRLGMALEFLVDGPCDCDCHATHARNTRRDDAREADGDPPRRRRRRPKPVDACGEHDQSCPHAFKLPQHNMVQAVLQKKLRRAGKHVRTATVHELRSGRSDRSQKQADLVSDNLAACGTRTLIDVGSLAKAISSMAALTTLRCGSNPGMVGELDRHGNLETPDVHIEALQQLLNALKPSGVTDLDISAIGIGPTGADRVADYVRDTRAVLASLNLSGADFGYCYILGGAWSIAVGQMVTWSSHNNEIPAGTVGEVAKKHDESNWVVQFPGAKPYYFPTDTLSQPQQPCVFQAFCTSLKVSSITELNLSSCGLKSAALHIFSEYVREAAAAALASFSISNNEAIGEAGADPLMDTIRMTQNIAIHHIKHDGCNIREEVSLFFTRWSKLSSWAPDNLAQDTDDELVQLARCAAEYQHPLMAQFLQGAAFRGKTVQDFLCLLSGKMIELDDPTETLLDIARVSKYPDVKTWAKRYGTLRG